MIALVPSGEDLDDLVLDGYEQREELHLTLAFLGEMFAFNRDDCIRMMSAATGYFTQPIVTELFSVSAFNAHTDDFDTAVVLGVRGEEIVHKRQAMLDQLADEGVIVPEQFQPWLPHVTLAYTDDLSILPTLADRLGSVVFDTLRFAFGDEVIDIPLYDEALQEEPLTASNTIEFMLDAFDISTLPPNLRKYWLGPEGSARVGGWGNKGSWTKCTIEMRKEGVPKRMIKGLCTNLYHEATGRYPGSKKEEHALTAAGGWTSPSISTVDDDVEVIETPQYCEWSGILTLEGMESGDGRMFSVGSLEWQNLPLPLMYQPANSGGHSGSVLVGKITEVWRDGTSIMGRGVVDTHTEYGPEAARLLDDEMMNGVSVDVDKVAESDLQFLYGDDPATPRLTVFSRGRVRGATMVAFPAFIEAQIFLTGDPLTASTLDLLSAEQTEDQEEITPEEPITAAAHTITIPDLPPAAWFDEPTDVPIRGALTVTDEGRIYGLLAPGGTKHRGRGVTVPVRNVDYSRFHGREVIVEGGGRVVCGVLTMDCGHAATEGYGTLQNRVDHYDNTCSVVANVRVGTRADGAVWVAGAVAPFVDARQVSRMMSCTLSGDWQPHSDRPGVREFIAALLVPVPGYAMARTEASVQFDGDDLLTASIPVETKQATEEEILLATAMVKKRLLQQRMLEGR
jgi:2'-5' RNA ligase